MAKIVDPLPAGLASEAQIAAFEQHIGHPLPAAYRAFLLRHNGGHPDPDALTLNTEFGPQEDIVFCFFPLRDLGLGTVEVEELDQLKTWPLHCAWDDLQNDLVNLYEVELDEPLLPIGTDGSTNYFCVVLTGDRAGSIVFLDNETAEPTALAPGFDEFLASLRPRERTDYAF